MGSTFTSLRIHIVFSTKERRPWIKPGWRTTLHEYLGGTVRGLGAVPEAIGGVEDHVHLLIGYRPTLTISDFVRELKKASSNWVAEQFEPQFGLQDGYSAFSVSASQKEHVRIYIGNQEAHHQRRSFREELAELLMRHGIEVNPEHLK